MSWTPPAISFEIAVDRSINWKQLLESRISSDAKYDVRQDGAFAVQARRPYLPSIRQNVEYWLTPLVTVCERNTMKGENPLVKFVFQGMIEPVTTPQPNDSAVVLNFTFAFEESAGNVVGGVALLAIVSMIIISSLTSGMAAPFVRDAVVVAVLLLICSPFAVSAYAQHRQKLLMESYRQLTKSLLLASG